MRVQHNIPAMNAYRNFNSNTKAIAKNLEKLSSGYRINRAGDDAAGLAISEKMRAQITGLNVAQKNAKDGISLVQTAEGALTEVHSMLNRMFSLAEQSSNGTYDNEVDRANLQKEFSALRTEIDRIADASNFNGQALLNGDLKTTTTTTTTEVATLGTVATTNGHTPAAATEAKITIQLGSTDTAGGIGPIELTTTDAAALGAMTADGKALSDLFTLKVNGVDTDWTDSTAFAADDKIELEAKTAGALSGTAMSAFTSITGATVTAVNGKDEGAGTAATKAEYTLNFDFTKLAGGQTFSIGDKTFEFTLDGNVAAGNTAINLFGLDLTDAGSPGAGQQGAAEAIQAAVAGALGTTFDSAVPAAAPSSNAYTLTLTANDANAGEAGNLGVVRVSESATGIISSTYSKGLAAGEDNPGTFAQATYSLDLSKLKAGDELTIGSTKVTVVADDATVAAGQIKLEDAADANKLATVFETAGYTAGKVKFDTTANTVTITDTAVGGTGAALAAGAGKVALKTGDVTTTSTTTGGLTLQIGDTADSYNKLTVGISDMHAAALGLATLDIGNQKGASDAMATIKTAINSVSGTRGDLGALQNRLEHTINNLGVMEENIQDAEATIRDTDVAQEMMAYTKNNILVQSAQAMLAQANQLPQGVLQLLG